MSSKDQESQQRLRTLVLKHVMSDVPEDQEIYVAAGTKRTSHTRVISMSCEKTRLEGWSLVRLLLEVNTF